MKNRMWCKKCNKIVYSNICDVCGEKTQEDIPVQIYWCSHCNIPIIKEVIDSDHSCPLCGSDSKYIGTDLRPVFPEERLLFEAMINKPLAHAEESVWAVANKYICNGKIFSISRDDYSKLDAKKISRVIEDNRNANTYQFFDKYIELFLQANKERLMVLKDEATTFVRDQVAAFPNHQLVISFSGGKDSTVVEDIVVRALADPSIVHIFGDTTLEFPITYDYVNRFKKNNPRVIFKTAKNKEQDFYSVCDQIGPPARMMRWCCTMFKTGPITRVLTSVFKDSKILTFYGIRKHESVSRSKYDRVANSADVKIQKQTVAAPIFYWNDIDVWLYILGEKVDFNDAYRLGYDRVGCWCCPNNNTRAQFMAKIYMEKQSEKWRSYLIEFAKKIGKPDPEVYIDEGWWKARQGGNGLQAAEDVKIRFTSCTAEDHAKIYKLNKAVSDEFFNLFVPFGSVNKDLGRKLLNEVLVLDLSTNVPILSIQPFTSDEYSYSVKVRTLNVADHDNLQRMVSYQIRKYNACRKCLKCESVCSFGAITVNSFGYYIDEKKCKHCKKCVNIKYLEGGCLMDRFLRSKED